LIKAAFFNRSLLLYHTICVFLPFYDNLFGYKKTTCSCLSVDITAFTGDEKFSFGVMQLS